jgi:predicted enzyme related to lactoylglutathione lyase
MSIKIKEIAFVFHAVTDVARARKFYGDLLGLKTGAEFELAPGKWWIEYDIAGQALGISNAMGSSKPASSLVLEVANLEEAYAACQANGANISMAITEFPPCRMFQIKDHDGNEVGLHQRKAQPDDKETVFPPVKS